MEKLFEKGELPPHQAAFFEEKPAEEPPAPDEDNTTAMYFDLSKTEGFDPNTFAVDLDMPHFVLNWPMDILSQCL